MKGPITGYDLGKTDCLLLPWKRENGVTCLPFSFDAARLSLELAATAYDMEADNWRASGWHDFSFMVDDSLLTGRDANGGTGTGWTHLLSDYLQRLTQSKLRRANPISQLLGTLRQSDKDKSDTCKAIVMIRRCSGLYVVGIGFMGTGKRMQDWISNLRIGREEDAHQGFLQLTREFEGCLSQIEFPETAQELGVDKLTLADILNECRFPGSRFRLWMAGHSQGASIMQLLARRQVRTGFLRQYMMGYGFASPCVMYASEAGLYGYPLYHILNADDVTPRVGALLHVGRCRIYCPDEDFRMLCYGEQSQQDEAFREVLNWIHCADNMPDALVFLSALTDTLEALTDEEALSAVSSWAAKLLPEKWTDSLGSRLDGVLRKMKERIEKEYIQITGRGTAEDRRYRLFRARIGKTVEKIGARRTLSLLSQGFGLPHKLRLRGENDLQASYSCIVNCHLCECGDYLDNRSLRRRLSIRKRRRPRSRFARVRCQ